MPLITVTLHTSNGPVITSYLDIGAALRTIASYTKSGKSFTVTQKPE